MNDPITEVFEAIGSDDTWLVAGLLDDMVQEMEESGKPFYYNELQVNNFGSGAEGSIILNYEHVEGKDTPAGHFAIGDEHFRDLIYQLCIAYAML